MATEKEMRTGVLAQLDNIIDHLYGFITPGTPVEYKTATLTEALPDMTLNVADARAVQLMDLGILTREVKYGRHLPDGTWKVGRYAMWDLHMDKDAAKATLKAWGDKYMTGDVALSTAERDMARAKVSKAAKPKDPTNYKNQPRVAPGGPIERLAADSKLVDAIAEDAIASDARSIAPFREDKVAIATKPDEVTRAVAGPDAPKPLAALSSARKPDEAIALVAAARQYNRGDRIAEQVTALQKAAETLGITIDPQVFAAGIKVEHDERLETVALLLPYIDSLESRIERMGRQLSESRDKVREAEQLANDNRRLRGRIEALISDKVVSAQRTQA